MGLIEEWFLMLLHCVTLFGAAGGYGFEEGKYSVQGVTGEGVALLNDLLGCFDLYGRLEGE